MIRTKLIAGLALAMLACGARAEDAATSTTEMVENPAYKSWAATGLGTTVVIEGKTAASGMNMTMEITMVLAEKDAEKVVIETGMKMSMQGMPQPQEMPKQKTTINAKVPKGQENLPPDMKGEAKEAGNEKVEVAGKSYDCKVVEFKGGTGEGEVKGKTWNSAEVPGNIVKMTMDGVSNGQPMSVTMDLKSVDKK